MRTFIFSTIVIVSLVLNSSTDALAIKRVGNNNADLFGASRSQSEQRRDLKQIFDGVNGILGFHKPETDHKSKKDSANDNLRPEGDFERPTATKPFGNF